MTIISPSPNSPSSQPPPPPPQSSTTPPPSSSGSGPPQPLAPSVSPSPPPPLSITPAPSTSNPPPPQLSKPPSTSSPPPTPLSDPPQNSPQPPESSPALTESKSPPPPGPPPSSDNPPRNSSPPPPDKPASSPNPPRISPASPPAIVSLSSPPPPSRVSLSPPSNPSPSDKGTSKSPTPNATEISPSTSNNGGPDKGVILAGSVVAGIIVLALFGLAVWCLRRQKTKVSRFGDHATSSSPLSPLPTPDSFHVKVQSSVPLIQKGSNSDFLNPPPEPAKVGNSRSLFTYEELVKATNGFSAHNLLGEGGFGSVYKGYLPDGREVAVKELKIGGGQGEREFKAEVEIIGRIHHRHLVSLISYCISENQRLLVYDYVPNNTLYYHLHSKVEGRAALNWAARFKIAAGAARGIAYLHEDCHPRIIHRDIKSSNILLDHYFEACVSDFGLAKLALDADTHVTTRVMGTFGYVAPEYASSGKLTEKSDVYSFGVVLLEIITGRRPVDTSQPLGDESLVQWARPLLSHALDSAEFRKLVDPALGNNYIEGEMLRVVEIAAACVRHSAAKRPRMGQVVRAFESLGTCDLSNGMKVGESEGFDPAQRSEELRFFRRMAFGGQDFSTEFFNQSNL